MKIAITGHTGTLGKHLVNMFPDDEVIGISRSTGFDLTTDYLKCVEVMKDCDIVFNNACIGIIQSDIIRDLKSEKCIVITSGSMAANYTYSQYCIDKRDVEKTFFEYRQYYPGRCLLLKMGYLNENHRGLMPIPINTVIDSIRLFMYNTRISLIEMSNI